MRNWSRTAALNDADAISEYLAEKQAIASFAGNLEPESENPLLQEVSLAEVMGR